MTRRVLLCALLVCGACTALPLTRRSPYHAADADLSITRITHSSLIVEMPGARFLVDPWFHSHRLTRQIEPLGLTPEALPAYNAILITHGHDGHFDETFLTTLVASSPQVIAPVALHNRLAGLGFTRITDLSWWDTTTVGSATITAVPADHAAYENGYVLSAPSATAYLAGDTRYFDSMVDIAAAFPALDVALLPVGGERLLGARREMTPEDAARAALLFDASRVIPIGYGARGGFPFVWYASDPVTRFTAALKAQDFAPSRIVVLEPGQSWHYYRRPAPGGGDHH